MLDQDLALHSEMTTTIIGFSTTIIPVRPWTGSFWIRGARNVRPQYSSTSHADHNFGEVGPLIAFVPNIGVGVDAEGGFGFTHRNLFYNRKLYTSVFVAAFFRVVTSKRALFCQILLR